MEHFVTFDNVCKYYQMGENRIAAADHVTFHIEKGEFCIIVGPSGAGKTTTIKLLTRQLRPGAGEIAVFGAPIARLDSAAYEQIGILSDNSGVYERMSIYENMKLFADLRGLPASRIGEVLEKVGLADAGKRVAKKLSKGMRQRLILAMAVLHRPRLLFLDEPTSGLDPSGAVLFRKIIEQERKKGTTVFVTTHNMVDADLLCDRVAFISNGNLVALDTPKRLKEKNSNHRVVIDYLYQGQREAKTIEAPELEAGIPFAHDEIISIHSQEPTLEDMFIQYTGRGLS